jgi:hypothetical protein
MTPLWTLRRRYLKFGTSLIHLGEIHEHTLPIPGDSYVWRTRAMCRRLNTNFFHLEPIGWRLWSTDLERVTCTRCLALMKGAETVPQAGFEPVETR